MLIVRNLLRNIFMEMFILSVYYTVHIIIKMHAERKNNGFFFTVHIYLMYFVRTLYIY